MLIASAALWSGPITAAEARGYHPNPPRGQGSGAPQASPDSNAATPEGCFRRYDDRCQRARESRRASHGSAGSR